MKNRFPYMLSQLLGTAALIFACLALPFILFAGIGLLIALPFAYFSYNERAVTEIMKRNEPLTDAAYKQRGLRILYCFVGMLTVLSFIRWSNSVGFSGDPSAATRAFLINSGWATLISLIMLSPQLLYRKK